MSCADGRPLRVVTQGRSLAAIGSSRCARFLGAREGAAAPVSPSLLELLSPSGGPLLCGLKTV